MITINKHMQTQMIVTTLDEIVPENSIFRKIDKHIDFTFIYDEVKDLYSSDNGRPSVDPVVLFKLVFIQAIDGIKSMRKLCEKIKVDAEYRWFLGIPFSEATPHFSTFSKNYERRFKGTDVFENIFINIVKQAQSYGMLNEEFFTDSTHKKANANKNKSENKVVFEIEKRIHWLEEEINEERIELGKKPFEYEDKVKKKSIKISKTDPESGYYHRSHKEKGFMYLDHRTTNGKCNIITDVHITKGNVHDSTPLINRVEYHRDKLGLKISVLGLDSGYDNIEIKKYLEDNLIFGVIQYRRYGEGKTDVRKYKFKYIKEIDAYSCPVTGVILPYRNLNKQGYKEYHDKEQCEGCPLKKECCPKATHRKLRRHIKEELNEVYRERRLSNLGKEILSKRRTTIERSFADSKQNHGYRYSMHKGIEKNQNYSWLICAAQNMKNIALKRETATNNSNISGFFTQKVNNFKKIMNLTKKIAKRKQTQFSFFKTMGLSTV